MSNACVLSCAELRADLLGVGKDTREWKATAATLTPDTRVRSRVILVPAYRMLTSAGHTVTFRNERMHRVAPICPVAAN